MKRIPILLVLLALVAAACASQEAASASPSEAAATVEPTPEPTEVETREPSEEPEASDDGSGSGFTGDLADALPDEVGGHPIQTVEGIEQLILPALAQQGIDAEEADFAFASWGEGTDAVFLTALRMPGLNQTQLQMLAGIMASASGSGAAGGVDFESDTTTVGGKDVLQMTGEGVPGAAYIYLADDAFFTVVGESPELAEELLSKLP